uniref:Uncharacterized protein n=1 Tax=viral metagenome TaxID=1070528 RepID=A0A6M3JMZ6_9ZZZZ
MDTRTEIASNIFMVYLDNLLKANITKEKHEEVLKNMPATSVELADNLLEALTLPKYSTMEQKWGGGSTDD